MCAVNSIQSAEQSKKTLAFFLLGAMAETSLETLSGQASSLMQVRRYWPACDLWMFPDVCTGVSGFPPLSYFGVATEGVSSTARFIHALEHFSLIPVWL